MLPCLTHAQVDGNNELRRQQDRERAIRQQNESDPSARVTVPEAEGLAWPDREVPCHPIHRVALQGPKASRFGWALDAIDQVDDSYVGRCLGTRGIDVLMRRLQNAIVARGYVTTRVLASAQDLNAGVLHLQLVAGTVRAVHIEAAETGRVTIRNAVPVRQGDLLNLRDIEQGLENLKRVPTAEADIQIRPADTGEPGQSDLAIIWSQRFPIRVAATADNSGSEATGRYVGSATVSLDHPLTLNDLFYISATHALGSRASHTTRGHVAHYSVPWNAWLLALTGSGNSYYQTVAGATQNYIYSGSSRNAEARVSRLVWRDASRKTTTGVRVWARESKNFIDDTEIEVQRRRMVGWEWGVSHREYLGSVTIDANLQWRRGTGAWNALLAPEQSFGEGTSRPALWLADAQFALPWRWGEVGLRYSMAWRAQRNRTPLVPQDRFAIGGRYTVRGFDGDLSLTGDRGWLMRNDLGVGLGASGVEAYLALDGGHVGGRSTQELLGQNLMGAALGVRGAWGHANWDFFVGRPVHKPEGFRTAATTTAVQLGASF